ncbi:hypothetical protein PUN28_013716 [Cardiocondyla obscurior]|uniref:Uncharacterized protein n=1 Tax=Cardiocondyla obscurior TaxID=286306 RepID=A0AAW2F6B2_9HYME
MIPRCYIATAIAIIANVYFAASIDFSKCDRKVGKSILNGTISKLFEISENTFRSLRISFLYLLVGLEKEKGEARETDIEMLRNRETGIQAGSPVLGKPRVQCHRNFSNKFFN